MQAFTGACHPSGPTRQKSRTPYQKYQKSEIIYQKSRFPFEKWACFGNAHAQYQPQACSRAIIGEMGRVFIYHACAIALRMRYCRRYGPEITGEIRNQT